LGKKALIEIKKLKKKRLGVVGFSYPAILL
jgi:hypothetical protein